MSDLPKVEAILERQGRFRELRKKMEAERVGSLATATDGPWISAVHATTSWPVSRSRITSGGVGFPCWFSQIARRLTRIAFTNPPPK